MHPDNTKNNKVKSPSATAPKVIDLTNSSSTKKPPSTVKLDKALSANLKKIEQKAFTQLGDLVDNLADLNPTEKFNFIIKIIRKSHRPDMLEKAYSVALKIPDAEDKAQALLIITEEIEFFTQPRNEK